MFFGSISSNRDEVLLINPSADAFVFGDINIHHKDWRSYSAGTNRSGKFCFNFFISNGLTQMVWFPTWIPDCDSHSPGLLDLFLSSDASISSTMAFPPLANSFMLFSQFPLEFPSYLEQDALFHHIAYGYSGAIVMVYVII